MSLSCRRIIVAALCVAASLIWIAPAAQAADPAANCRLPLRFDFGEGIPSNWNTFVRPVGDVKVTLLFRGYSNPAGEVAKYRPAADFFNTSSYGKARMTVDAYPGQVSVSDAAVRALEELPDTTDALSGQAAASAWHDAIRSADPYFDFSKTDAVALIDAYTGRSYAEANPIYVDGRWIKAGTVVGTDWPQHRAKVVGHELGHVFSLPDLYGGSTGHDYVGAWDIMGNLGGGSPDLFAWHKWKLGWLDDAQMSCVSTVNSGVTETLTPLETAGGTKAVVVRYGTDQAYVAEVRTTKGLNSAACDTGILVYRVNSNTQTGGGPVRVMDSRPGSSCGAPGFNYPVNDGAYDPGQTFVDGNVRIQVVSQSGDNYVVRASYGTPSPDPRFDLGLSPASGTVAAGGSVSATVTSRLLSGSAEQITLSAGGLPAGVTASFSPATITAGQSSTMTLTASGTAKDTVATVGVKGVASSGERTRPYALTVTGRPAVFADDFEASGGWVVNPAGTDTATKGFFERADPEATVFGGRTYQRGDATSGVNVLVTGAVGAGQDAGVNDLDGGVTSVRSPEILLPASGPISLSLQAYIAHADNASASDYLRVKVGSTVVFERLGAAVHRPGAWTAATADLSSFAGQKVRVTVEAADNAGPSMFEAAVDDLKIS